MTFKFFQFEIESLSVFIQQLRLNSGTVFSVAAHFRLIREEMASSTKTDVRRVKEMPDSVVDPRTNKKYVTGQLLGKGGFARCYELTDIATKEIFAGKVVSKTVLTKQHQKDKMAQEVAIHRSLSHQHIVKFYGFFEDPDNVYILLELCRKRSLMEMHKRRKTLSEPETRYFLHQIVSACKYLHDNRVIHRDLKLGNLFITEEMEIKIGDFGLATKLEFDGERKKTLCGTPNYIAPEILSKKGHSYEVDVWSLGCMLYTLLVGKPPFETTCLKDTYSKIKKNEYRIPSRITPAARNLIQSLLQSDPGKRPTMAKILCDEFMTTGYFPSRLPASCLTVAPRFDGKEDMSISLNPGQYAQLDIAKGKIPAKAGLAPLREQGQLQMVGAEAAGNDKNDPQEGKDDEPEVCLLTDLMTQLSNVVSCKPWDKVIKNEDDAEDPCAIPMIWISKWVDYSDKYGLGYQLNDNSVGVYFNDTTKLSLLADGDNIQYIEKNGMEHHHTLQSFPEILNKKVTVLKYFRDYMSVNLVKAGASMTPRDGDELSRLPYMKSWFRTRSAIVMLLTNGTVQINFLKDHTKLIMCPLMGAVTYFDENRGFRTYRFNLIEQFGCCKELAIRLRYAREAVDKLKATIKPRAGS